MNIYDNLVQTPRCRTNNGFYSTLSVIISSMKTENFTLYPSFLIYNRETISILYYFVSLISLSLSLFREVDPQQMTYHPVHQDTQPSAEVDPLGPTVLI